jgi:AraC-like DNA-binding protein
MIVECRFRPVEVATRLGLSIRSFDRLVRDSLGIAPGLWLRQLRAVAARKRVRDSEPIKSIAYELGFLHQADFARDFKNWYDISPADFRNKTGRHAELCVAPPETE